MNKRRSAVPQFGCSAVRKDRTAHRGGAEAQRIGVRRSVVREFGCSAVRPFDGTKRDNCSPRRRGGAEVVS